jgi:hypothetical protein
MDWDEFKNKLGNIQLPTPDNGFAEKFLFSRNSIHLTIGKWASGNLELILDTVSILEKRGAKRERDYIITATWQKIGTNDFGLESISIHTTDSYMSQEDFIDVEMG